MVLDKSDTSKTQSPIKVEGHSSPILTHHRTSIFKNMLGDAIWKSKWQDLKPVLDQRKRQERQTVFKQDSRHGNQIFQQIYDREIANFKAMLSSKQSKSAEPP